MKEILRISGERMRYSETSAGTPKTTFSTPLGSPASVSARANSSVVPGVSSAGLMMQVHPAARAGAILRAGVTAGKFHGVKQATGLCDRLPHIGQARRDNTARRELSACCLMAEQDSRRPSEWRRLFWHRRRSD